MMYSKKVDGGRFLSPHFQVKEFYSSYSDTIKIEPSLINILEQIYTTLNCSKITINSGYRTPNHSVAVGGYATDDHTKGLAADIKCYDSKGVIIPARLVCITAEDLGVRAIGYINDKSTHISARTSPKWFGNEQTGGSFSSFYTYFGIQKNVPVTPVVKDVIGVGSKVTINPNPLTRYATGQLIPPRYKNKVYTVAQMGNGRALIKELMSWVLLKDLK